MKRAEKSIFVENLTEELKSAKSVILINYRGLSVKAQQELKRRLAEVGAHMLVVKNTLLKRAGEAADVDKEVLTDTVLSGQTALVITDENALAPIGILGKFAKEYEVPQFKVGIVEGNFQDNEALVKLSSLPSKDALWGQLLGVLAGPSYGLVGTLSSNMQKLVYILNQKSEARSTKSEINSNV